MDISQIEKRDGRIVAFEKEKIVEAIFKAAKAVGGRNRQTAEILADKVIELAEYQSMDSFEILSVEDIQDLVERVLVKNGHYKTAKAYILYRKQHENIRDSKQLLENNEIIKSYLDRSDWRVKENSNMNFSLQGMNFHVSSIVTSQYWLNQIYTPQMKKAQEAGDFHIHDLGILAVYCVGWDLQDLLREGFKGARGKVVSKPAKHFRAILGQIVNFFYTLQGEAAGAQAFSNFDTLLAPFIHYDNLDYRQVKQSLQEFIFNINVPTRVGFQCMSADTEILAVDGWKKHEEVKPGDIIATFNVEKGYIEHLPVKRVFAREYQGKMYNLKNPISDQLISPQHRIVRKKFSSAQYVLETIEDVLALESPFTVPLGSDGNVKGKTDLTVDIIKLLAWVISTGSLATDDKGNPEISIDCLEGKNSTSSGEIAELCRKLGWNYSRNTEKEAGAMTDILKLDQDSTEKLLAIIAADKKAGIKFIPDKILQADTESARIFLETYIRGNAHEGAIVVTSEIIKDQLLQVIVNAGYSATVSTSKPNGELSAKDHFVIIINRHKDTAINNVTEVDYSGVIWCPNTDNETVIARRNGKIFITGNTPFTNITMDLKVPKHMQDEPAIIGGKLMDKTYKDFQKEMDILNKAFAEVMMEGDAEERVFTFPIPTYNITKDFDWDNPEYDKIWEMTAKYGTPGFSNYINSDMDPEDARSMCCRLRLDNRELRKRGGGLFGSNPLTGSIGVVTINMPSIGYKAIDKEDYLAKLADIMDLAKDSLEIKRKVLENLTESGLYPYSQFYLRGVKQATEQHWVNHFSTIGLVGMNESCLNFLGQDIASPAGHQFALEVLKFMKDRILAYQAETGNLYNLEATPAEGVSYSMPQKDRERFPDIIFANNDAVKNQGAQPFYTNSTHLPVGYTDDLFESMQLQDPLQSMYTGGTTFHIFLGEALPDNASVKRLIKKSCELFTMPYFYISPTFSICPQHGYITGEHFLCPTCEAEGINTTCEVYSRVVGYLRPVDQWNEGKQQEFKNRQTYNVG